MNLKTIKMNEKLVSLKTAKLAKSKGFDIPTIWYYHPSYGLSANSFHEHDEMENMNSNDWAKGYYSAPTQSLLQKWIREKEEIHIEIYANESGWGWILTKLNGTTIKEINNDVFYRTYEDALEIAIIESLKF